MSIETNIKWNSELGVARLLISKLRIPNLKIFPVYFHKRQINIHNFGTAGEKRPNEIPSLIGKKGYNGPFENSNKPKKKKTRIRKETEIFFPPLHQQRKS